MSKDFLTRVKIITIFCFVALTAAFAANPLSPNVIDETTAIDNSQSGAELFEANCARCHGSDGRGGKGPDLASEKRQAKWRDSDAKLIRKITKGGVFMPSFGKKLKAEEIKQIAGHVRTLKD